MNDTPLASKSLKLASVLAVILIALELTPASAVQQRTLEPIDWSERVRDGAVPAAGGVRAGVITGAPDARVDRSQLTVHLPAVQAGRLCVSVSSIDAFYTAELEFDITGLTAASYRLNLPTEHDLSRYAARDLAVLAEVRTSCAPGSSLGAVIVASWEAGSRPDSQLILLNAGNADMTKIISIDKNGGISEAICTTVAEGVAYNTQCLLRLSANGSSRTTFIQRYHFGNPLPKIPLPLRIP